MLTTLYLTAILASAPLHVGDKAPDFTVQDTENHPHTLSEAVGHGPVILAFFPKAFTSGCTQELTAFREKYRDLAAKTAQVFAISADDAETLAKFRASIAAQYPFISDASGKLRELYGVQKQFLVINERTTYVIDKQQKIVRIDTGSDAVDITHATGALGQ